MFSIFLPPNVKNAFIAHFYNYNNLLIKWGVKKQKQKHKKLKFKRLLRILICMETDNSRPYQFLAKFWWEIYSIVILQQVWGMLENIDLAVSILSCTKPPPITPAALFMCPVVVLF